MITWYFEHWSFDFYREDVLWWDNGVPMCVFGVAQDEDGGAYSFSMDIEEDGRISDVSYQTCGGDDFEGPNLSGLLINPDFKY